MKTLEHKFVEFIPEQVEEGILYITIEYRTAVHKCVCGCGNKVVTPITPTDWKLTFDGKTVSLYPSIGNWNFPCRSHYWIQRNAIEHSYKWSDKEIESGRKKDTKRKKKYLKWFSKRSKNKPEN
jgi:hypothetical protein